jgi:hypothetical protein
MLLLALLAATMLVASPALAAPQGSKYDKNYYPNGYYDYCHPDGAYYWGHAADEHCDKYYTDYKKKKYEGKWYYYVHVYYVWDDADYVEHTKDYWYYAKYKKYDDPNSTKPYFKAWVGYKPTHDYYWENFYYSAP